jgi:hypothetical protein
MSAVVEDLTRENKRLRAALSGQQIQSKELRDLLDAMRHRASLAEQVRERLLSPAPQHFLLSRMIAYFSTSLDHPTAFGTLLQMTQLVTRVCDLFGTDCTKDGGAIACLSASPSPLSWLHHTASGAGKAAEAALACGTKRFWLCVSVSVCVCLCACCVRTRVCT